MATLKWILIVAAAGYLSLLALLYVAQRALMYFPDTVRAAPADAGFPEAQEALLDTADGARMVVWHVPPREGKPVILYFHGNGGALRHRVRRNTARSRRWHRACRLVLSRLWRLDRFAERGGVIRRRARGL